jgi:NAD(P)-dependent dehydrogenase (short-subunit alcohol dehydrogenase family)
VITGGLGVLCSEMARALAKAGAKIAVLNRTLTAAPVLLDEIRQAGGEIIAIQCDVLDRAALQSACAQVLEAYGQVDILINGAGGNKPQATAGAGISFFDLPPDALAYVFDLNLLGTIYPCQVFGAQMAKQGHGVILNVSSMSSYRSLTRVVAYSAAKAAVNNFTGWLAVYLAREYSPNIRVNAIAPGFLITGQNRYLLTDQATGEPSERGKSILGHTPMGRFGLPQDLTGAVLWLVSPASAFVSGAVVPVDGGFNAYSGV